MSAPNSAYSVKTLELHNVGVVKYDNLLALKLSEYGENIKSLFYLDRLVVVDGAFAGAVQEGSFNASMHANPRIGKGRLKDSATGIVFIILNDGGLNTFALSNITSRLTSHVNHVKVNTNYKSSFYDNSTERGYEYRTETSGWIRQIGSTEELLRQQQISVQEIIYTSEEQPQNLYIRPYIINNEGFKPGNEIGFSATEGISEIDAMKRVSACDPSGQVNVQFWMRISDIQQLSTVPDIGTSTGLFGYLDDEFTIPLPNGLYWGLVPNKSLLVVSGEFQQSIECPVTPTLDFTVSIEVGDEGGYIVYIVLEAEKSTDVRVIGRIASYNSSDEEITGDSGDGNFDITVPQGETINNQATTYVPAPSAAYIKCVVTSTTPTGLIFESYPL